MEITILGSGTVTPSLRRNASALAIRSKESWILVDIGPGTIRRMCEARIDTKLLDAILITHFHPDHVADLVPFLFASNYAFGPVRKKPFYVVGPTGLEQFYQGLVGVYDRWIVPSGNRLLLCELNHARSEFNTLPGVSVGSTDSTHSAPGRAYRIEAEGVSVTVTGDTDVSEAITALAQDTDILVCECSLPENWKVPGHLTPSEAGAMAAAAGARKLVLTHFYPPCDEVDVVAQAAEAFPGPIVKAEDLMVIKV